MAHFDAVEPTPAREPPVQTAEEREPPVPDTSVRAPETQTLIDRTIAEGVSVAGPKPRSRVLGALDPGTRIGRYMIVERIGAGAMGVVYAAFDPQLDRKVALKLLRPAGHRVDVERATQRLLREAQALAKLKHPNVVTVHDVGTYLDQIFVAMEYIDGPTLGAWMERPHPHAEILRVFCDAGEGLAAAHAAGLVHRDFKPENVMIGDDGRPRVMDFGLARSPQELEQELSQELAPDDPGGPRRPASGDALSTPLTQTGALMGTPAYMAPEQHMGLLADAKSDQFAFCVALYEALYGQRPFQGKTIALLGVAVTTGNFAELPRDKKIPAWLRTVLLKGLSVSAAERYDGIPALLEALRDDPSRRRQRLLGIGVAAVITGLIALGVYKLATEDQRACEGGQQQFARSWGADKANAMRTAFVATQRDWAETSADQLSGELDRFAGRWSGIHRDACLATRVRGERSEAMLDKQMVCLDRTQREFDALVDQLMRADADTVDAATRASTELPALEACENLDALQRGVAPPPRELAGAVAQARTELAKAHAARLTGHLEPARAGLAAATGSAMDYAPYAAEHHLERGALAMFAGELEASATAFEQAYGLALEHGVDEVAARAAAELVYVAGYRLAHHEAGRTWAVQAEHWTQRVDPGGPLQALAYHNTGVLLDASGDSAGAEPMYRAALEMRTKVFGESHPLVGRSTHNLGNIYLDTGDYTQARAHYQKAIDIYHRTYGEMHPIVAGSLNNLGLAYRRDRMFEPALEALAKAVAIYEGAFGEVHPDVALSLDNLGLAYIQAGRAEQARPFVDRAMAIRRQLLDARHPDIADSLCSVARLELALGNADAARAAADAALPMYREAFGDTHFQIAASSQLIGHAALMQGEFAVAVERLGVADRLRREQASAPWERAESAAKLSLARLATGDAEGAREAHARAVADYRAAGPTLAPELEAYEGEYRKASAATGGATPAAKR